MKHQNVLTEFNDIINSIYGVYLDSTSGFVQNKALMEKLQHDAIKRDNLSQEYLDNCAMRYGVGDPNLSSSYVLNKCTQKEFKERNSGVGTTISHLAICALFRFINSGKIIIEVN